MRLWLVLAASASFLTTTDARRIEGGAKALAAAIKLSNSAQRMIASPFYPILPSSQKPLESLQSLAMRSAKIQGIAFESHPPATHRSPRRKPLATRPHREVQAFQ